MATKIVTELRDDIEGSDAAQTIRFALGGVEYEIDLSDRNANRLRNIFAEFVGHARKVGGARSRKGTTFAVADKSQTGAMREWLREHGYEVSDRGRIPGWLAGCNRFITSVIDHVPAEYQPRYGPLTAVLKGPLALCNPQPVSRRGIRRHRAPVPTAARTG